MRIVGRPDDVFHFGDLGRGEIALLLHVVKRDAFRVAQQQVARTGLEDLVDAVQLNLLRHFVFQVFNLDRMCPVESCKF